jgi:hypothetical protein
LNEPQHIKILFRLQVADEWPDVDVEGMWAVPLGGDRFRLDNIPFHALGVSDQDVILAGHGDDSGIWFQEVVEPSEFSTLRIAVKDAEDKEPARELFRKLGAESEGLRSAIFALSIPRNALPRIMSEIEAGEASGRWDWEEGVIRP